MKVDSKRDSLVQQNRKKKKRKEKKKNRMFATMNPDVEPVVFMTDCCQYGAAYCMRKLALPSGRVSLLGSKVSKGTYATIV